MLSIKESYPITFTTKDGKRIEGKYKLLGFSMLGIDYTPPRYLTEEDTNRFLSNVLDDLNSRVKEVRFNAQHVATDCALGEKGVILYDLNCYGFPHETELAEYDYTASEHILIYPNSDECTAEALQQLWEQQFKDWNINVAFNVVPDGENLKLIYF